MFVGTKEPRRPWPGGYIHRQKDGRDLFIIEREIAVRVNGESKRRRFHVSTRAHGWKAAMKQLERFEADPENYDPAGKAPELPLLITAELVDEFWNWQVEKKGCTTKHANAVSNRLADWTEDLGTVDLRAKDPSAMLRDLIKPALDRRETMRGYRIAALKAFYAWLRKEKHLLSSAQDPTLDLAVPQSVPEKRKRRKAVAIERVRAVLPELETPYRELLVLAAATGWHTTELERFIRDDDSEIILAQRESTIAVLAVLHKNGERVRSPIVDPDALTAAQLLRARRKMPKRPNEALKAACGKVGVKEFTFGVMRHSVGTWLSESGLTKEQIAQFLHHKDPRTTDAFYTDVEVPTVAVAPPTLRAISGQKR